MNERPRITLDSLQPKVIGGSIEITAPSAPQANTVAPDVVLQLPLAHIVTSIQNSALTDEIYTDSEMVPRVSHIRGFIVGGLSGIVLSVVTIFGALFLLNSNSPDQLRVVAMTENTSSHETEKFEAKQSEDPVPSAVVKAYQVGALYPKTLYIPKIDTEPRRIMRLSTDESGSMEIPENIWDIGWYESSGLPRDTTMNPLLIGHSTSSSGASGAFYNLYRLSTGDDITITLGDNTTAIYRVTKKEDIPDGPSDLGYLLTPLNQGKQGLTLMTANGDINPETKKADKRIVIFAERVN
jgi:sortase (surface protein transpeptidase)